MFRVLGSSLHRLPAPHPRTENTFLLCCSRQSPCRVTSGKHPHIVDQGTQRCLRAGALALTSDILDGQADAPRNDLAIQNFWGGGLLGCMGRPISLTRCPLAYRERTCSSLSSYSSGSSLHNSRPFPQPTHPSWSEAFCGASCRQVLR